MHDKSNITSKLGTSAHISENEKHIDLIYHDL